MKLSTKTIMATTIGIASLASCSQANNEEIVEKPNLKVVDGKFTPEILEGLGRVSGICVSPDGKKVLYGVQYERRRQSTHSPHHHCFKRAERDIYRRRLEDCIHRSRRRWHATVHHECRRQRPQVHL